MAITSIFNSDLYVMDPDRGRDVYGSLLEKYYDRAASSLSDDEVRNWLSGYEGEQWYRITRDISNALSPAQFILHGEGVFMDEDHLGFELCSRLWDFLRDGNWKEYDSFQIWDEEGALHLLAEKGEKRVDADIKCISDKGQEYLNEWYFSDQDYDLEMLWNDPNLTYEPHLVENTPGISSIDRVLDSDKHALNALVHEDKSRLLTLTDRASKAKEVSAEMAQDSPERNVDIDAR